MKNKNLNEQTGTAWCSHCLAQHPFQYCSAVGKPCNTNFNIQNISCAACTALFPSYSTGLTDNCNQPGQPCHNPINPWTGGKGQAQAPQSPQADKRPNTFSGTDGKPVRVNESQLKNIIKEALREQHTKLLREANQPQNQTSSKPKSCYRIDAGGCLKCSPKECNKKTTPCKYSTPDCKTPKPTNESKMLNEEVTCADQFLFEMDLCDQTTANGSAAELACDQGAAANYSTCKAGGYSIGGNPRGEDMISTKTKGMTSWGSNGGGFPHPKDNPQG